MNGGLGQAMRVAAATFAEHGIDITTDRISNNSGADAAPVLASPSASTGAGADGDCAPRRRPSARNAVPCLGYPSRSAAALALREGGMKMSAIADALGCARGSIGNMIAAEARRQNKPFPAAYGPTYSHKLIVNDADMRVFAVHADKRHISVSALIRRLLDAISKDDLVEAILDDGGVQ